MNPYTTAQTGTLTIDSRQLPINGQRNVLEMAREAGIEIPTFCYHSELSVYGACRLCLVEVEGRGIVTSCSTAPEPGMVVRTNTHAIRKLRRVAVELLLANHDATLPDLQPLRLLQAARPRGALGRPRQPPGFGLQEKGPRPQLPRRRARSQSLRPLWRLRARL